MRIVLWNQAKSQAHPFISIPATNGFALKIQSNLRKYAPDVRKMAQACGILGR